MNDTNTRYILYKDKQQAPGKGGEHLDRAGAVVIILGWQTDGVSAGTSLPEKQQGARRERSRLRGNVHAEHAAASFSDEQNAGDVPRIVDDVPEKAALTQTSEETRAARVQRRSESYFCSVVESNCDVEPQNGAQKQRDLDDGE